MVTATHEAMAIEIGSARAVISRQLGGFAKLGLIELTRGHIALLDRRALEHLPHSAE
jgi:CRP/FNR family transcriptional regulator